MAAAGTSPALNLREKLAELAGLKQRVSPDLVRCDFTNLVTNGGFDTDVTGWSVSNGAILSLSSNTMRVTNGVSGRAGAAQFFSTTIGKTYKLSFDGIAGSAPDIFAYLGTSSGSGSMGSLTNVNGTDLQLTFVATAATTWLTLLPSNTGNGNYAYFDNITIYEADFSDDAPWLRLPFGYKVGKRGMIVRDGVILHPSDYTEITDSGQTFIKPIVAPGVSTEFSIWAGA